MYPEFYYPNTPYWQYTPYDSRDNNLIYMFWSEPGGSSINWPCAQIEWHNLDKARRIDLTEKNPPGTGGSAH